MGTLRDDLRLAFRALVRRPSTSLLVILSVAVAIGANTAFFGALRGLMLRPLPYPEQDRLVILWQLDRGAGEDPETLASEAELLAWQRETRSFESLAGMVAGSHAVTSTEVPEEVRGGRVTPAFLPLFGGRALHGRLLQPSDVEPGAPPVVVLDHDYWQRRFDADPAAVGRKVRIDEREHTVAGVLPPEFAYMQPGTALWLPLTLSDATARSDAHDLLVFGRLARGVTAAAASAELDALAARRAAMYPQTNRGLGARAARMRDEFPGPTDRKLFTMVQGAVGLLLLIACANVANILVARGQDRQRELAVRAALGAGRWRTLRLLLTESALLAGAASLLGLALAAVFIALLRKGLAGELGEAMLPTLDLGVVAFDVALAAAAALLFGLGPALATVGRDLTAWLRQRGEAAPRGRLHRVLVVLEVTLALVMLSATGLLITSLRAMRTLDSGFDERGLATFQLKLPPRYADADLAAAVARIGERLAAAPGVEGVTATSALPRTRGIPTSPFTIEGEEAPEGTRAAATFALSIVPSYFDTLGIPRRAGRWLTAVDRAGSPDVAVVSAEFARRYLRSGALGRRVVIDGRPREVVGVAGDVVQTRTLEEGGLRNPIVYLPLAQQPVRQLGFLVRTRVEPSSAASLIRREVAAFDPLLVPSTPQSMRELIDAQFGGARVFGKMLAGFAAIALALAALGVYGVISYAVARRKREIGVRIAVGARPRDVVRHFAAQGAAMTGLGLALAVPAVLLVARGVAAIFGGSFPVVWLSLPAIAALLGATALLASWLPARRAARLDPSAVLAGE